MGTEQVIVALGASGVESFQSQTDRVNVAITGLENAGKSAAVTADGAAKITASAERSVTSLERGALRVARKMSTLIDKLSSRDGKSLTDDAGLATAERGLAVDSVSKGAGFATRLARAGVPLPIALAGGAIDAAYNEGAGLLKLKAEREKEIEEAQVKASKDMHDAYLKHQELRRANEQRYQHDLDAQFREAAKVAELNAAFGGARLRNG